MTGQPAPDHAGESIQTRLAADEARILAQTPTTTEGPRPGVDDETMWLLPPIADGMVTADLLRVGAPLLEAAQALAGKKVGVWIAGGIRVGNLFALRATDPAQLRHLDVDPVGNPENDAAIARAVTLSRAYGGRVIAAWGADPMVTERGPHVRDLIGSPLLCLGTTRAGHPRHPLYVRGDTAPIPYAR